MGAKAPQIEQGHKGPGGTLMSSCSGERLLECLICKGEWYLLEQFLGLQKNPTESTADSFKSLVPSFPTLSPASNFVHYAVHFL